MAREVNKLNARKVATLATPGRHADGAGLYLVIDPNGSKRWVMLYRLPGRRREMGLGATNAVSLAKARELAAEARAQIQAGVDPLEARKEAKAEQPAAKVTFGDVAIAYIDARASTWQNAKHRAQWRQTLEGLGAKVWRRPVDKIGTDDVMAVLRPIWSEKTETATRLRGRIESVLDAARVAGQRSGENPARWRGHLEHLLPRPSKLKRGHHPAMHYDDVPAFYAKLEAKSGHSAMVLRIAILTATRSGEARGMAWSEIDTKRALWVIPKERMKAKREHRVPLSKPAIELLEDLRADDPSPDQLVFPTRNGTPLSDMALLMLVRKAKVGHFTPHGFRTSFRTWVDEKTDVAGDVAEAALAHLTGDETERAYRRGDALEKRRRLMDQWASFVTTDVPLMNDSRST